MKKGYVYFLPPLLLLAIFGGIYWNFRTGYDAHLADIAAQKEAARKKKVDDQNASTNAAFEKATKDIEIARAKRDADDAKKQKEAEDYENALQARLKAQNESNDATQTALRLKTDIDTIEKEMEELALNKKTAEAEQVHMRELVKMAVAEVAVKNDALKKVQDAQDAWQKKMNDLLRQAKQQQK